MSRMVVATVLLIMAAAACGGMPGAPGTVRGEICFPSEYIPAMTVYLEEVATKAVTEVPIAENQSTFEAQVPAGRYVAYAWLADRSLGGSYSDAVPCGLTIECTDHTLIAFTVEAGGEVQGVDVCDWYGPDDVPRPPESPSSRIYTDVL